MKKLDKLIEDFNSWVKSTDEYLLSTDSAHAEFCESFGYGDGEISTDRIDDEAKSLIEELKASDKDWKSKLAECCALEQIGIYCQDNEIFSVSIGECEEEIPGISGNESKNSRRKISKNFGNGLRLTSRTNGIGKPLTLISVMTMSDS